MVGTIEAHVKNMCIGVTEGFEYHMKVVYSHFPIQLKLQGEKLEIAQFPWREKGPVCEDRIRCKGESKY